jgi:ArsR family transcriptional regulator, arsenate/arsenite/antimonite-responsive transcriptional repressor
MKQLDHVKIFKALSNDQRLALFKNIYKWEKNSLKPDETIECCGGITGAFTKACGCMKLSRSTISHHIKELQSAGLVTCTRDGQSVICRVNQEAVDSIKNFLE